jgi:hypothetical protein
MGLKDLLAETFMTEEKNLDPKRWGTLELAVLRDSSGHPNSSCFSDCRT